MPDYFFTDFTHPGFYRVWYGRTHPPAGPYADIRQLAEALRLSDHPDDGMIVHYDDYGISLVPSLNPDDLMPPEIDEEDAAWLASEAHRAAYAKSPWGRTPDEQTMADEIGGAIVRSGGEDGDFPWLNTTD